MYVGKETNVLTSSGASCDNLRYGSRGQYCAVKYRDETWDWSWDYYRDPMCTRTVSIGCDKASCFDEHWTCMTLQQFNDCNQWHGMACLDRDKRGKLSFSNYHFTMEIVILLALLAFSGALAFNKADSEESWYKLNICTKCDGHEMNYQGVSGRRVRIESNATWLTVDGASCSNEPSYGSNGYYCSVGSSWDYASKLNDPHRFWNAPTYGGPCESEPIVSVSDGWESRNDIVCFEKVEHTFTPTALPVAPRVCSTESWACVPLRAWNDCNSKHDMHCLDRECK
ncbi:ORF22 [White sturgeon adenovirus 1]|uniref:ORF22 n=1 Tax=White sturgeon adenovirus 1 TaxID=2580388 RepID=A0A4P8PIQ2_9ADEN|nr:ORF22 [White sturgeon adenovirus 1]QCQ84172.1 ORF22 [White sturgeon adenovirus 1]